MFAKAHFLTAIHPPIRTNNAVFRGYKTHSKIILCLLASFLFCTGCADIHCPGSSCQDHSTRLLRHVVLFKFKSDTTPGKVKEIEDAFAALPAKIDAIHDFEWGTDVSVENLAQGYTHCFLVTFRTAADRAKYLPHPEHKKFGSILGPHLDKVLVVDYWTGP